MLYILYIYDLFHIILSVWHTFGSTEYMYTCLCVEHFVLFLLMSQFTVAATPKK